MKSAIFLSGWEYNRLLADDPFRSTTSGLPAQVLWDGAAQFWLFETVFCSKESLDGDLAAANDLGWTTGFIFEDLRRRGFLRTVVWSELGHVARDVRQGVESAWNDLRNRFTPNDVLNLLISGRDDVLEEIKLELLAPVLGHLGCVQNISPNSIRHWVKSDTDQSAPGSVASGLRVLAEPLSRERMLLRAGFSLCRPPGTGVSRIEAHRQQVVEQQIQKPMIPRLLAGLLPQNEYHNALRATAAVYEPINRQLHSDYTANVERLERLRDAAKVDLWPLLHGEWLPRLEAEPSFLADFKRLVATSVKHSRLSPYLDWATDIAIMATSAVVGVGTEIVSGAAGADTLQSKVAGKSAENVTRRVIESVAARIKQRTAGLTLFYQKARRILSEKNE